MTATIKTKIEQSVQASWDYHKEILMVELSDACKRIDDILKLEEHKRSGHKSEQLKKSFGSHSSFSVNINSLSALLANSEQATAMQPERLQRVEALGKRLHEQAEKAKQKPLLFHFKGNCDDIIQQAEAHLNAQAETFCAIRIAQLEARAKYKPELHQAFFEDFNWSILDDDEIALCAPVVVLLEMQKTFEQLFIELLPLLSSGLPIKIFVLQGKLSSRKLPSSSRAAVSSSSINIELLPLALHKVFVFQSTFPGESFERLLSQGLKTSRAGLFSLLQTDDASNEIALDSRAFPCFSYDPASSPHFVTRFELGGNPQLEKLWVTKELNYLNDAGQEADMSVDLTFADYLLSQNESNSEFSILDNAEDRADHLVPLAQYLCLTPSERVAKVPVVYRLNAEQSLQILVPSRDVILQADEKMNAWQALREMAGIDNPLVQKTKLAVEEQLTSEKQQALASLQTEWEAKSRNRESQAVNNAINNLSLSLLGLEEAPLPRATANIPVSSLEPDVQTVSAAQETTEVADESDSPNVSEEAWIETNLCTSCEECIGINSKLFAYNDQKLAYIKDPKGGAFKDIVKAAELCPPHIIHPGTPQDPNEKNLDKLIKKAEPYQ